MLDGQSQPLPAVAHPAPVPSGHLRGATIQPHVHPTRTYCVTTYPLYYVIYVIVKNINYICVANHYIFL